MFGQVMEGDQAGGLGASLMSSLILRDRELAKVEFAHTSQIRIEFVPVKRPQPTFEEVLFRGENRFSTTRIDAHIAEAARTQEERDRRHFSVQDAITARDLAP